MWLMVPVVCVYVTVVCVVFSACEGAAYCVCDMCMSGVCI